MLPVSAVTQRVFVGDVQGCADEFADLLERLRAEFGDGFELWSVGDLVNRGPDNLAVLRLMRELVDTGRGRVVLGNHELNLLRVAAGQRALAPHDSIGDVLAAPDCGDWLDWLRGLPLVEAGRVGGRDFAMVHAASHPAWPLAALRAAGAAASERLAAPSRAEALAFLAAEPEAGDANDGLRRLTSCRSVTGVEGWSSRLPEEVGRDARPWHLAWLEAGHAHGIVYGHWALQGLHLAPGLRGLDTGCVHHGRGHDGFLTAWLPDESAEDPFALPDDRIWQVPARAAYYAHKDTGSPKHIG